MAIKNSIPLKGNDDPRSVAIRAKTKGSGSLKRKLAQRVRRIKENPDKYDEEIKELITNPESSAIQIQKLANDILDSKRLKPIVKIALLKALCDKHKTFFGSKVEVGLKETSWEIFINRMKEYKKKNGMEVKK